MFKKIFFLVFASLFAVSCNAQKMVESTAYNFMLKTLLSHTVSEVSVESAVQQKDSVVFLDARAKQEFEVSHIAQAHWVGYDNFSTTQLPAITKDQKIIVYCSVGYRSEKIAEKLENAGFTDVANLYGGLFEWVNQGNEVINEQGTTQQVHAFDKIWGVWLKKGEKVY